MEPIGGLTVFSLLSLLLQGHPDLVGANVEWHIVPCIDPDGAILNEGWTQQPLNLENHMRHFFAQSPEDQVDMSFPLYHKKLRWDRPSMEASLLKAVIDEVIPDFYYSLHNARIGTGAFYYFKGSVDQAYFAALHELLAKYSISLNAPNFKRHPRYAEHVYERFSIAYYYDLIETSSTQNPEDVLADVGAGAPEYLLELKRDALVLTTELTFLQHPCEGTTTDTGESLRQVRLRIDADNKYLCSAIIEEWGRTQEFLDPTSPFYQKIQKELIAKKGTLHEGLPVFWAPERTRDLIFDPQLAGTMTEHDRFFVYLWCRYWPLCHAYSFVRLLQTANPHPAVSAAVVRLEALFSQALEQLDKILHFSQFKAIDLDSLAAAQLGSGLIMINSLLDQLASDSARFERAKAE